MVEEKDVREAGGGVVYTCRGETLYVSKNTTTQSEEQGRHGGGETIKKEKRWRKEGSESIYKCMRQKQERRSVCMGEGTEEEGSKRPAVN